MLNLELLAQGGDHSIVKVRTIISDDPFGDTVSENEILLDEAGNSILSNGCEGRCFDPLGEIIHGHENEAVAIGGRRLDLSNHVDSQRRAKELLRRLEEQEARAPCLHRFDICDRCGSVDSSQLPW